ncbi:DUF4280 domain-containing protein [Paenibacillus sp. FSL W8-0919]|uniref:DUF4280 domain-containing protein n=1 Tax=Paenibacillus sp. FSL W8-0919 TaxID=2954707 RepID=UPI0030FD0F7E
MSTRMMMAPEAVSSAAPEKSYVVAGAVLSCSYGTQRVALTMPVSHGVFIKDKAQMNIQDYHPMLNIKPFGNCRSMENPAVQAANTPLPDPNNPDEEVKPQIVDGIVRKAPCTPIITMPWIGGKTDVLIENEPALLNTCTNTCMYCGIIRIEDDGQEA